MLVQPTIESYPSPDLCHHNDDDDEDHDADADAAADDDDDRNDFLGMMVDRDDSTAHY